MKDFKQIFVNKKSAKSTTKNMKCPSCQNMRVYSKLTNPKMICPDCNKEVKMRSIGGRVKQIGT